MVSGPTRIVAEWRAVSRMRRAGVEWVRAASRAAERVVRSVVIVARTAARLRRWIAEGSAAALRAPRMAAAVSSSQSV